MKNNQNREKSSKIQPKKTVNGKDNGQQRKITKLTDVTKHETNPAKKMCKPGMTLRPKNDPKGKSLAVRQVKE